MMLVITIISSLLLLLPSLQGMDPKKDVRNHANRLLAETPVDTSYKVYDNDAARDTYSLTINTNYGFTHVQEVSDLSQCTACILENLRLDTDAFDISGLCNAFPNLTALYIHNMPITAITLSAVRHHAKLKHLEITNTNLTEFPCSDILTTFPQLRSIFVKQNNKLQRMTYPISYSRLREVDMQDNAFEAIDLNKMLTLSAKLDYINLSGNPIKQIRWKPEDFIEHEKAPEVILKRVNFDVDTKSQLREASADANKIYLWMKKFIPGACVFSSGICGFYAIPGDRRMKMLLYGIGIPVSYCVGRLVVDTLLFPGTEKKVVYFVPIYDE
jgi:Asp-tRNA(Asn)/Glu-tRNA(Gln) amidotransferase C subunit